MEQPYFNCPTCGKKYKHFFLMCKHVRIEHDNKVFQKQITYRCSMCFDYFYDYEKYVSHLRRCNNFTTQSKCFYCGYGFKCKNGMVKHLIRHKYQFGFAKDSRLPKLSEDSKFMLSRHAFKAFLQQYELYSEKKFDDSTEFLTFYKIDLIELISSIIDKVGQIKSQFCLSVSFAKQMNDIEIYSIGYFCTSQLTINNVQQFKEYYPQLIDYFNNAVENYTSLGSGWYIHDVDRIDVRIGIYNPLVGSCNGILPKELINKKALINIKNHDNKCFLYNIIAALYPAKNNPQRVSNYKKYVSKFNLKNVTFPMAVNKIPKFEELNKHLEISINVFTWNCENNEPGKRKILQPHHTSMVTKYKTQINLLLIDEHYFYIKNFNRLMNNFGSTTHHYCVNCFATFQTKVLLSKHKERCLVFKPCIARMPIETTMCFNKYHQMKRIPFVMYADFESILKPTVNVRNNTQILNNHIPCGYSFIVIQGQSDVYYHNSYRGENCMEIFMKDLKNISFKINEELSYNLPMNTLTDEEKMKHQSATHCFICKKEFNTGVKDENGFENIKVRDHCHITGQYNGAAHNNCNLNYKVPEFIPLLFHNLKGYDAHFIIKNIKENLFTKCEIIPQNMEKFISFTLDHIRVLDSFQFLSESLDKLVNNLRKSGNDFPITREIFNNKFKYSEDLNQYLYRKSIYPYEYMDDFIKFEEKCLPDKKNFYSSLNFSDISDSDYKHAQEIWGHFNIQTLGEYHDFYVNLDTCLLADVFQAFRKTILEEYELEACSFFSIPGLAWSAALKVSDVKLELLKVVDDYTFFEFGIRGGMCGVNRRFCKANNPKVENYDPEKPLKYLTYLDFNNLYGWAMNQKLPQCDFEWLFEEEYENIDWKEIDTEGKVGYVLELDLHYPKELHDLHSDFPLAPNKCKIKNEQLSQYQLNTIENLKQYGYRRTPTEKLMQTLDDKDNYVIHFKNLKLYLQLGLIIKKIHRVLKFTQNDFLKSYIEKNTILRQNSKNDFEKDLFKLMNNSVFGKSIQDQRKHLNIKLALNESQASKYLKKPNFTSFLILDEDKTLINMRKTVVDLNRPIFIGFTVLELSKWLMYDKHYNYFKKYYGPNIELAYFDTDSYLYQVRTNDIIEDLGTVFKNIMDFSNFDKDHKYYDNSKAKVIGYLKSEYGNQVLKKFVGLKAKLYSIIYGDDENKHTAKGLQKAVMRKFVKHQHYMDVIKENNIFCATSRRIQSKEHIISTIQQNKLIFTPFDDKRYLLNNGVQSIPFGHYLLKKD